MVFKLASMTIAAAAAAATTAAPVAEEEEYYSSWSLFLVCSLLILSLLTSYYLQIKRIRAVHETLVSIFAGMFVGLIIRLAPGTMIREMLTFKHTLFFNLLLPPIILNSGYELKQDNFFRNFGSILTFAFLGTFISAVGVGILVFIYSYLGIDTDRLPLIECLIFGSTLSATDPVTILAIFNQYKVDPKLYTVIFGESLLNDAVSIVMYETLSQFHGTEVYLMSIFHGVGIFLLSFTVSMALGVAFGLATSLMLKHSYLHLYPSIESCLVSLCAYTCYFFSNGLSMSGIVSLLFCGITLKHYAYHTMSRRTQRATKYIFSTLARLSENFIFIYLGMSLFTSAPVSEPVFSYVKPVFIFITTIAVVFTRYAAVFPLSEGINLFQKHVRGQRNEELPHSYQMMLFWAGLRGAVGVALAAGFKGPNAQMMRTTVLIVVVLTVLIFGGTTARMLEVLGIRTGVEDDVSVSSDEDEAINPPSRNAWVGRGGGGHGRWNRFAEEDSSALHSPGGPRGPGRIGSHYASRSYNHQFQSSHDGGPQSPLVRGGDNNNTMFSPTSSESYDSDGGEVLPLAPTSHDNQNERTGHPPRQNSFTASMGIGEDGKWFQALDERYLLPIFSNATASRTFHARRARRTSGMAGVGASSASNLGTPADSEDEVDLAGQDVEMGRQGGRQPQVINIGGGGGSGANNNNNSSSNNGGGGGSGPGNFNNSRSVSTDDSRIERGLPSPVLRSGANGSGDARFS
ncbi:sodium/hydrogen exchanger [Agrocybe pediades]|nr:sodium/hydrogen exchanger [Agrocybe pediades]